ncbi:hypothetical protein GN956_G12853 [Arapaima gigas]
MRNSSRDKSFMFLRSSRLRRFTLQLHVSIREELHTVHGEPVEQPQAVSGWHLSKGDPPQVGRVLQGWDHGAGVECWSKGGNGQFDSRQEESIYRISMATKFVSKVTGLPLGSTALRSFSSTKPFYQTAFIAF